MKKAILLLMGMLLVLLLVPSCFGEIIGSGNLETREFDYSDFTRVEVGSAFEVEVVQSDSFRISVTADDNLFDYLDVSKSGETLKIRLRFGYNYTFCTKRARITMPNLYGLNLSGATHGTVEGFSSSHDFILGLSGVSSLGMADMAAGDIEFELSGASNLTGSITARGNAELDLSGASSVTLSGSAEDIDINASGASHLEMENFPVNDADVSFSGASSGTINLDGTLDASLSGGSHLEYIGELTLGDLDISGGSTISKK